MAQSTRSQAATAQTEPVDYTDHPLTGIWLAKANPPSPDDPQFPAPSWYGADGLVVISFPVSHAGRNGVEFQSAVVGTWEPHDETTGHFTAVQTLSNIEGVFLGSVTIDGFPKVNEDGQSFIDDGSLAFVTIRDATGAIVQTVPGLAGRPVTAMRMGVGAPGFQEGTPAATPAS